ncbi:uncharacterized protein LOC121392817 [Gigantopelta aegis]|uniref:uncharacterized protein LOC121392817 n=1 Tax=Gigantopelta aegis TaxID=1735272 RepID=UPI001B887B3A|nr:uncharacterized protein LOC121392817 [Gigantopelta aegis]
MSDSNTEREACEGLLEIEQKKRRRKSVKHCCVPGCNYNRSYEPDERQPAIFHSFPKNELLKKQWMRNIRRQVLSRKGPNVPAFNFTMSTNMVCSDHFLPTDYAKSDTERKRGLNKGAVPTVFNFQDAQVDEKSPQKKTKLSTSKGKSRSNSDEEADSETPDWALSDHDYMSVSVSIEDQLEAACRRIKTLEHLLEEEKKANFTLERLASNDAKICKYTGFEDYETFQSMFVNLQPSAETMARWAKVCKLTGTAINNLDDGFKTDELPIVDQFFLFLTRMRCAFDEDTIAYLFGVSQQMVNKISISWTHYLHSVLGSATVWPTRDAVKKKLPKCFKVLYPNTRVILFRPEIKVQTFSPNVSDATCSSGMVTKTYKSIVGISPNGAVVFVGKLFPYHTCDKDICVVSKLIDRIDEGDEVMVLGKGFNIEGLLKTKKATVVFLPFLNQDKPTSYASSLVAHVERVIARVTEFKILQEPIPPSLACCAGQLWNVCALLTNFRGPVLLT